MFIKVLRPGHGTAKVTGTSCVFVCLCVCVCVIAGVSPKTNEMSFCPEGGLDGGIEGLSGEQINTDRLAPDGENTIPPAKSSLFSLTQSLLLSLPLSCLHSVSLVISPLLHHGQCD